MFISTIICARLLSWDGFTRLNPAPIPRFATSRKTDRNGQRVEAPATPRKTILCVDDDIPTLELVREIFDEFSACEILTARDTMRALEILITRKVDLVLLDMRLPGTSGPELLERLRSNPATCHIPVIFMTASVELCKDGSLDGTRCLYKPFDLETLVREVLDTLSAAEYQGSHILVDSKVKERGVRSNGESRGSANL